MDTVSHNPTFEAESQAEPFFLYPENREFVGVGSTKPIIRRNGILAPFFYSVILALVVGLIASPFEPRIFSPIITGLLAFPLAFMAIYLFQHSTYRRFLNEGQLLEGRVIASGFLKTDALHSLAFGLLNKYTGFALLLPGSWRDIGGPPHSFGAENWGNYSGGTGDFHPWLRYIFRSPEGRVISAVEKIIAKNVSRLPERGTPVKVLYLSDRKYHLL